ncbi:Acetyltransferase (GNAT) family protein [Lentzea albidocapillata subsp. violacea]|uniref:Acetyltransferase (GNAT) family protein n=1 Tax=Lentzea albidocapillata subsp. violacea TaxID=128104 RepID=A0A1G8WYA7_9PSEU|nr:GNAT family N-acetyltransferase [Lentzea albidocapillata]SDJ83194.1 Acetyltransferase (GNAT) family protein [Lentzea albidocapillata subsp. violacea]
MIRRVEPRDVDAAVGLVHELALYEKAPEQCHLTAEQLHTALFNESPALFGHVAEVDGEVVGIALWFLNFSTWDGVHGIYLEDLYVTPDQRGNGLGKQLLEALAQECVAKGYTRLQWWVLNWNEPSIGFYRSLGAVPMDEWTTMRVAEEALVRLGSAR